MPEPTIFDGRRVLSPVEVTKVLAWLVEREPVMDVPTYSQGRCRCCGHGPYFHRLDDATNISPTDPEAKFRCIWPIPEGPPVQICACSDFIAPHNAQPTDAENLPQTGSSGDGDA